MGAGRRVVVAKGAAEGVGGMGAMTAETAEREEGRGEVVVWVHCQAGAAAVRAAAVRVAARAVAGVGKRVATLAAAMASARVAVLEMCRTAKEKNNKTAAAASAWLSAFYGFTSPHTGQFLG